MNTRPARQMRMTSVFFPNRHYYSQLMAMVTWAKKKFKQICQYRAKSTYCGYMGDYKKIKK